MSGAGIRCHPVGGDGIKLLVNSSRIYNCAFGIARLQLKEHALQFGFKNYGPLDENRAAPAGMRLNTRVRKTKRIQAATAANKASVNTDTSNRLCSPRPVETGALDGNNRRPSGFGGVHRVEESGFIF